MNGGWLGAWGYPRAERAAFGVDPALGAAGCLFRECLAVGPGGLVQVVLRRIQQPHEAADIDAFGTARLALSGVQRCTWGSMYRGITFDASEGPSYDFRSQLLRNHLVFTARATAILRPFLYEILRVRYSTCANDTMTLGGSGTQLRGSQCGDVVTDNAILLNNEKRFTVAPHFLFGKRTAALFADVYHYLNSFDSATPLSTLVPASACATARASLAAWSCRRTWAST